MKTIESISYTFTPGTAGNGTVDLSSISNFLVSRLYAVVNTNASTVLYAAGVPGVGYTALNGAVLSLQIDTSAMSASDPLMIVYDDPNATTVVTAALGPSQTPAKSLAVTLQDGQMITVTGTALGTLSNSTYTTGAIPTAGYMSASVQLTSIGASNSVVYEVSNDGVSWYSQATSNTSDSGSSMSTTNTNLALRQFPISAAFFRVRVTAYTSGTVTALINLKATNLAPTSTYVSGSVSASINTTSGSGGAASVSRIASSAATVNATVAKSSAGRVMNIVGYNNGSTVLRIKFYNVTTTPVPGTTTILFSLPLPPGLFQFDLGSIGWYFTNGISYSLLTNALDSDTTAIAAGAITDLNIHYA